MSQITARNQLQAIAILAAGLAVATAQGSPTAFTDRTDFEAAVTALAGTANDPDFDTLADGTIIPSGSSLGETHFVYDFGVVQIQVRAVVDSTTLDTTSLPNFAGSDDAGMLQDGDDFLLTFDEPINAVGLSITTADAMLADDVQLSANGAVASLNPAAVQSTLDDGGSEFFLGVVDDELSFSIVQFSTTGGGYFLYTLDDLAIAAAPDGDDDGYADTADNCLVHANVDQIDSDGDGIGNVCDPDLNQDCIVNVVDLGLLKSLFFSADADADFNGDGVVNVVDLGIMKTLFFSPPGPSGIANSCDGGSVAATAIARGSGK